MLCEAAQATMKSPGPLRAFGERIKGRRGRNIAIVAVARKLTTLVWQLLTKEQDYIYERPALTYRKLRKLELTAGAPKRLNPRGSKGPGTPDNPKQWKQERTSSLHHEATYKNHADNWKQKPQVSKLT